jgi:ATP synthase I chain
MSEEAANGMGAVEESRMKARFQRNMYIYMIVALIGSWYLAEWRMAMGVLLGSVLSLFNKRWLEGSVGAVLNKAVVTGSGRVPPMTASKFVLRYLIIVVVIIAAVWTGSFHPLGIGIGFAAFVAAVMMEAAFQLYLIFSKNE